MRCPGDIAGPAGGDAVVDCHVHVACADAQAAGPPSLETSWWWKGGRGTGDELVRTLDEAGVEAAVVVQAMALYGYDCHCAAQVVARSGGRFSLVGALDMAGRDPAADLVALAAWAPLAGIRLMGVASGGAPWLSDGRGAAVFGEAARLGVVAVCTLFPDDLEALGTLAADHPATVVALEHGGFVDRGGPAAMGTLLALAGVGGLCVKVSSHNLDRPGDPAEFVDTLAGAFGADRLAWGSDHPQHGSLAYPEMVGLARRAARHLGDEERRQFLSGTSRRLWWAA